jgi:hypothetical protein
MTRTRVSSAVLLVAGLSWWSAAAPVAQRSQPRERSLYVTVVDKDGAPVPNLAPSDIVVKEDNLTREVLRVAPATDPMQIAVLVDTSQAAREHIQFMRQGLPPFVAELTAAGEGGRKNEIAIVAIGERPTILSDYSSDPAQIKKGIDRIWALDQSGMYLLDAIIEVANGMKKRESPRPVIIVIATSGPEFSNRHHDQVLTPLKDVGASLNALMLGQPDTSLNEEARERGIVLDVGSRDTGGTYEQLLSSLALPARLKLLANQLRHQYKVTYGRPESLIPPEKITVSAVKPGLVARGTPVKDGQR